MPLLLADAWLHDLDPFAIRIGGFPGGGLRWYGLSYLAGFALGFLIVRRVITAGQSPLKPAQVADFVVTLAIGIVIGGRLGYVLFYQPALLTQFTNDVPFWGVFAINQGGMASHGGILGGIGGCLFFAWRQKVPFAHALDLLAFGGPIGLFFGRVANFVNGELYGRRCPDDSPLAPLAVKFPQEMAEWLPRQLEDGSFTAADPQIAALDAGIYKATGYEAPSPFALVEYAIVKVQEGDAAVRAVVEPLLIPRHPSQLFAGVTEGLIVMAALLVVYRRPVKPGLVGGVFCIAYALMRVVNEFFRMPDAHLMADGNIPDVTRGQWLSIGLLLLGITTVVFALRSRQDKLGGWLGTGNRADDSAKA